MAQFLDVGSDFWAQFFVASLLLYLRQERAKRPLGGFVWLQDVVDGDIVDEILGALVDRVISQMHVYLLEVRVARLLVLHGAKSDDGFVGEVGIHFAFVDSAHDRVKPEIKLVAIEQIRIFDVPLDDKVLVYFVLKVPQVFEQENVIALGAAGRLCDVRGRLALLLLIVYEILVVKRQNERLRYEVEGLRIEMLRDPNDSLENILAPELAHVWIPVYDLIVAVKHALPVAENDHVGVLGRREAPIVVLLHERLVQTVSI